MTLRRISKVIETPKGIGQVLREDEVVAKVSYSLCVEMEEIFAKSFGGNEACVSHKSVTGEVSVLEGDIIPGDGPVAPSGPFTLVMQEGREVDFYVDNCVVKSNPIRQEYEIRGTGNKL